MQQPESVRALLAAVHAPGFSFPDHSHQHRPGEPVSGHRIGVAQLADPDRAENNCMWASIAVARLNPAVSFGALQNRHLFVHVFAVLDGWAVDLTARQLAGSEPGTALMPHPLVLPVVDYWHAVNSAAQEAGDVRFSGMYRWTGHGVEVLQGDPHAVMASWFHSAERSRAASAY